MEGFNQWIVPIFIIGVAIFYIPMMMKMNGKNNEKVTQYLEQFPDAAKVFPTYKWFWIINETTTINSVNGEEPAMFNEGAKGGFYIKPGQNKIKASYTHTRPGILHKSLTYYIDDVEIEINVEPSKRYQLSYDRKAENFTFTEV